MYAQHLTELQAQRAVNESVTCNMIVKAVGLYHGYIVLNIWRKQQAEVEDSELVTCERMVRLLHSIGGRSYLTPGTSNKQS